MASLVQFLVAAGVLGVFIWMLAGRSAANGGARPGGDQPIDPDDPRQLATLVGMLGGDCNDAAAAKFAVQRYREQNGRLPTTREIATLMGIMRSL